MSTNIRGLIDRVFREYLEPNDDLNSYTALASGISNSATEISFNADLLTQEEEDVMDAGTIIECDQELMYCTDVNTVAADDVTRCDPSGWAFASGGYLQIISGTTEDTSSEIKVLLRSS